MLANGPLVLEDQDNELRAIVFFNGLIKESSLLGTKYVANVSQKRNILQGLIYKMNLSMVQAMVEKNKIVNVQKVEDIYDIEYKLERITGSNL